MSQIVYLKADEYLKGCDFPMKCRNGQGFYKSMC